MALSWGYCKCFFEQGIKRMLDEAGFTAAADSADDSNGANGKSRRNGLEIVDRGILATS